MTEEVVVINGNKKEVNCLSCSCVKGEVEIPGDWILETDHFAVQQDFEIAIPGFMIIVSKRHIFAFDEFTEEERFEFIETVARVRKGMREALGIEQVYVFMREGSHHFHFWMLPRYDWMKEKFGEKIESVRPIMEYSRENLRSESDIKEVEQSAEKLRQYLAK